jgi:hypothetical protein
MPALRWMPELRVLPAGLLVFLSCGVGPLLCRDFAVAQGAGTPGRPADDWMVAEALAPSVASQVWKRSSANARG